jgi:hypothetical protein
VSPASQGLEGWQGLWFLEGCRTRRLGGLIEVPLFNGNKRPGFPEQQAEVGNVTQKAAQVRLASASLMTPRVSQPG